MHYFFAIILPPLAVWLSEARKQVVLSVVLWVGGLYMLSLAGPDAMQGAYAAGPVLYIAAVIHAFIFVHRKFQRDQGQIHPHRGTAAQAPPPEPNRQAANTETENESTGQQDGVDSRKG